MFNSEQIDTSEYRALAGSFATRSAALYALAKIPARDAGVEPQPSTHVLAIKGGPDGEATPIVYLAGRLQIQHHSAVELIDRLVNKGMLKRKRGNEDHREVRLSS